MPSGYKRAILLPRNPRIKPDQWLNEGKWK